eukprot:CAMPEP_0203859144 /NCGR_PEP_ID=MMETSP0359-20131031/11674_1 /ASSEMBLY_ACC=CAM_ASM_000338 /TAXON_ID=268821 /ORGANISM="Scrippsiella Hangoei, Strain SHTV-5" /LENGTH=119 /DNA_ID=CAMNT_0050776003 /DNA_START=75 /DNA_END=434 /DNA_ORIENTATION=+
MTMQISNTSDLELFMGMGAKKDTLTFFEGFESRSAGGGRAPPKGPHGGLALGAGGEKQQVLYSVRWVQAPKDKGAAGTSGGASRGKPGEVKKMNMTMELQGEGLGTSAVPVRLSGAYGV